LFFALWPDHARQAALAHATQDVVLACGGRAVPPEKFHVTLAFVGSVPESSVAKVEAIGHQVAIEVQRAPVQLTLDAIEYWKKAKVVCATAREPHNAGARLADTLATALKSRLTAVGFTPDLKPFRPHISLARNVPRGSHDHNMQAVLWSFTEFVLVESKTEPQAAAYRVLEFFSLGKPRS
jgi:2'-5' RNA ligase